MKTKTTTTTTNNNNSTTSTNKMSNHDSSPIATDEYKFLSKDGMYYKTYNEYVAANVRYNHNVLKEKGLLDKPSFRNTNSNNNATKRNLNGTFRQIQTSTTETRQTRSQTSRRRSNRLQQNKEATTDGRTVVTPSPTASNSSDTSITSFVFDDHPKKKVKKAKVTITSSMTTIRTTNELSTSERESLKSIPHQTWIPEMENYLETVEQISYQNQRSVMNQINKLCNGDGITYRQWPDHVCFYDNQIINLAVDCVNLYNDAIDYENTYGRDKGNGT
jgi:hypothetical protein